MLRFAENIPVSLSIHTSSWGMSDLLFFSHLVIRSTIHDEFGRKRHDTNSPKGVYKMKISMASMIFEFWVETGELKVKHNALNGRNLNKNYYLVRNAGCARSRYTLK